MDTIYIETDMIGNSEGRELKRDKQVISHVYIDSQAAETDALNRCSRIAPTAVAANLYLGEVM